MPCLRSQLCGSVEWPNDFLVSNRKPREHDVVSANHHSWLGSHEVSARPWFCGSTKKPSMASSCCSCHHAARTWPRWPPGPSNEAYLSSPHLEASPATTFPACSSPAPTPVKPQPAPAILRQESVHTTLSITHHTRKRPSTGPRTTHGPHRCCLEEGLELPSYPSLLRGGRLGAAAQKHGCGRQVLWCVLEECHTLKFPISGCE
jgi:hypothetical protein